MASDSSQKKQATVFYSWQSDLPNATNRGFIDDALQRAVKAIHKEDLLAIEPVVDRDTLGVAGTPDISQTIFQKIDTATAFVADVSIINESGSRLTPNPNVLIEVGYAIKSLGWDRIILVANRARGRIEELPFDLRSKRILAYELSGKLEGTEKAETRNPLQRSFEQALKAIFALAPPATVGGAFVQAITSIESGAASQESLCARVVPIIARKVEELNPKLVDEETEQWDEKLIGAIEETLPLVNDFARVAEAISINRSADAARGLFRGFADLFLQYRKPVNFGGHFNQAQFDLAKFIGHELMVILFSSLIAENRWEIVTKLCGQTVSVPNAEILSPTDTQVSFRYASEPVELLRVHGNKPKVNQVSVHANILSQRHESGDLAQVSPYRAFQEADVFLFLRSMSNRTGMRNVWRPWSAIFLNQCPSFWTAAVSQASAIELTEALGLTGVGELRNVLKEGYEALHRFFSSERFFFNGFTHPNPDLIGTR